MNVQIHAFDVPCLIAMSDGCLRDGGFDFVIASGQCDGRSLLLFECPRGTVRHSEQCLQSQRGASLRLTEETHLG